MRNSQLLCHARRPATLDGSRAVAAGEVCGSERCRDQLGDVPGDDDVGRRQHLDLDDDLTALAHDRAGLRVRRGSVPESASGLPVAPPKHSEMASPRHARGAPGVAWSAARQLPVTPRLRQHSSGQSASDQAGTQQQREVDRRPHHRRLGHRRRRHLPPTRPRATPASAYPRPACDLAADRQALRRGQHLADELWPFPGKWAGHHRHPMSLMGRLNRLGITTRAQSQRGAAPPRGDRPGHRASLIGLSISAAARLAVVAASGPPTPPPAQRRPPAHITQ